MNRCFLIAAFCALASLAGVAKAAVTINIFQDGSKVRISSSGGTLDTTGLNVDFNVLGLTDNSFAHGFAGIDAGAFGSGTSTPGLARFDFGGSNITRTASSGWTPGDGLRSTVTFTTGDETISVQNFSGDTVIYLVNTAIVGINTVGAFSAVTDLDEDLASLMYTPNESVTYSWGSDSITVVTSIPEPSASILLALGAFGVLFRRRRN